MRVLIVTDAWRPQVNGVVVTLEHTIEGLARLGHDVHVLSHEGFRTVPLPSYPEIRLAVGARAAVARRIDAFDPDAIHIATEGPLGLATRAHCVRSGRRFTTAWHTQFPEYVHARTRLPESWTYAWLRRFHARSDAIHVGTAALRERLAARGFDRLALWTRGVDTDLYAPGPRESKLRRPIFLNVGRVAVEKNLAAFLDLDLPGTKAVVGDGPARASLQRRYPDVVFAGTLRGPALASWYRAADVFVFPSRTDTFGLVLLEAMASGTPVAAYPVDGPRDVVLDPRAGVLDEDLRAAALAALDLDRSRVRAHALRYSWDEATVQFERCALLRDRYQ
jgi:glycosyltransferase involved in cell wall biosynthesis